MTKLGKTALSLALAVSLFLASRFANADIETTMPVSQELGTGVAESIFPVSLELNTGNLFLTQPVLLFINNQRLGLEVRFQAYDHRPEEGVALSEMGRAQISGELGFDASSRQILLFEPRIDKLAFDRENDATRDFHADLLATWTSFVADPIRADIPPHPYVSPFKDYIQGLSYDGQQININIVYQ